MQKRFITYAKNEGEGYGQYNVDHIVHWEVRGYTPGEGVEEDPEKMEVVIHTTAVSNLLNGNNIHVHSGQEAFQLAVALDDMVYAPEAFRENAAPRPVKGSR